MELGGRPRQILGPPLDGLEVHHVLFTPPLHEASNGFRVVLVDAASLDSLKPFRLQECGALEALLHHCVHLMG